MSRIHFCGEWQLSGLNENHTVDDRFEEFEYKPPSIRKYNVREEEENNMEEHSTLDDDPLNISYICAGGEYIPYSLLFLSGHEHQFFLQAHTDSENSSAFQKISFKRLFQSMIEKHFNFEMCTQIGQHKGINNNKVNAPQCQTSFQDSREMKQIICNNANCVLFEMMDGKLYLYDVGKVELFPFIIPHKSYAWCIGSGIMSSIVLVNDIWQDDIVALETKNSAWLKEDGTINEDKLTKIAFPEKPANIKFMRCYCRTLFLFVLTNNWLYVWHHGSATFGFHSCAEKTVTRVTTGFEADGNIVAIETGFAHVALLLDNGLVFVRGLNNFRQCSPNDVENLEEFFKIPLKAPVLSICCGSTCTCVTTRNDMIFFGEVYSTFIENSERTVPLFKEEYQTVFTSLWVHAKQYFNEEVALGPWHAFIYQRTFHVRQFHLQFFVNKLKEKVDNPILSDISIRTLICD
ncbi:hypothetical protein C9374_010128 [Naegleria lovaniensis]|uniref:Uncharacterized protein n=1 Tax=Naegleria lovaniensis TaxID=51637 RepID=A0AA88KG84_NAELO|nr:uncharacterized protein C9374_010128 [Naegleria lovaniensis]KAG2375124.1 hypothetical protein C9374_010128 [Naegleria lovaniensis]